MIVNKVRLDNFRSHQEAEFDLSPGINAIVGPGGAGKTSILDAIGYGVFGALPLGCKKSDLVTSEWREKGGFIIIDFDRDFSVEKGIPDGWSGLSTTGTRVLAEGEISIRDTIGDMYRMSPERMRTLFWNLIGITQGSIDVLFQAPTFERVKIFNRILDLEVYKQCSNWLLPLLNDMDHHCAMAEAELALAEKEMTEHSEIAARLVDLSNTEDAARTSLEFKNSQLAQLHTMIGDLSSFLDKTSAIEDEIKTLNQRVADRQYMLSWDEVDEVCPYCGQAIQDTAWAEAVADKKEVMDMMERVSALSDEVKQRESFRVDIDLDRAKEYAVKLSGEVRELNMVLVATRREMSVLKERVTSCDLNGIKSRIDKLAILKSRLGHLREVLGKVDRLIAGSISENAAALATSFCREIYPDATIEIDSTFEVRANLLGPELPFGALSKSQKGIVSLSIVLALAKMVSPFGIILLDEPFANMDRDQVEAVATAIRNCAWFQQVILTTHRADVEHIFDNVIFLEGI